jgi:hypothetical protein
MWWNKTQNVMAEPPSPRRLNLIAESMPYCQTAQKLDPLISYYSFIVLETRKCQTSLFHLWTSNASNYCWNEKMPLFIFFHSIQWPRTRTTVTYLNGKQVCNIWSVNYFEDKHQSFWLPQQSAPCRYLFDRVTNYKD